MIVVVHCGCQVFQGKAVKLRGTTNGSAGLQAAPARGARRIRSKHETGRLREVIESICRVLRVAIVKFSTMTSGASDRSFICSGVRQFCGGYWLR